jgi:hypothetical protein
MTQKGMRSFLAAFGAAHMHRGGLELNRRPLQLAKLRHAKAMPEANQDHGRIAMAATVAIVGSKSPGSSLLVFRNSVGGTSSCFT